MKTKKSTSPDYTGVSPEMVAFLEQMRAKCEAKAQDLKLASKELSVWDDKHEQELKTHFGYNNKSLAKRKKQLQIASANGQ